MNSWALSAGSFTVPGPLRTKKSPSGEASSPFQRRNTGSGLRWQLTTHTVLPSTTWGFGSMQVQARSPRPLRTTWGQMAEELVVAFELIEPCAHNRAVVGDADQQIAAFSIEEGGNGLEDDMGDALVVFAVLLEAPTQGRLEFEGFGFTAFDQSFGIAMAAQVLIEEQILDRFAKGRVIGDALVEIKVRLHDVLDHILHLLIEGEPHVLAGIHPRCVIETHIIGEPVHHLTEGEAVFGPQVQALQGILTVATAGLARSVR